MRGIGGSAAYVEPAGGSRSAARMSDARRRSVERGDRRVRGVTALAGGARGRLGLRAH
jgi:hypothetical protein